MRIALVASLAALVAGVSAQAGMAGSVKPSSSESSLSSTSETPAPSTTPSTRSEPPPSSTSLSPSTSTSASRPEQPQMAVKSSTYGIQRKWGTHCNTSIEVNASSENWGSILTCAENPHGPSVWYMEDDNDCYRRNDDKDGPPLACQWRSNWLGYSGARNGYACWLPTELQSEEMRTYGMTIP